MSLIQPETCLGIVTVDAFFKATDIAKSDLSKSVGTELQGVNSSLLSPF